MLGKLAALGLRVLLFLFGCVVLGLSVTFAKQQQLGDVPTTTRYSIFTGALAMIVALVGAALIFVESVAGLVAVAIDGVSAVLLLAGGIAWAVGLKGVNCNDPANVQVLLENPLLNQGSGTRPDGRTGFAILPDDNMTDDQVYSIMKPQCQRATADEVIQFLAFAVLIILCGLSFLISRNRGYGGRSSGYVA